MHIVDRNILLEVDRVLNLKVDNQRLAPYCNPD